MCREYNKGPQSPQFSQEHKPWAPLSHSKPPLPSQEVVSDPTSWLSKEQGNKVNDPWGSAPGLTGFVETDSTGSVLLLAPLWELEPGAGPFLPLFRGQTMEMPS